MTSRWGLSFPLDGVPLDAHAPVLAEAEASGYTDAWSYEVDGTDAFVPLGFAAATTKKLRLGTAIANVYTRGPATLAMTAATIAQAAPGRICLGMGAGSPAIVERWNGGRWERPLQRVRDVVTLVRAMLDGEKVNRELETVSVQGFRLSRPPPVPVPIFVAALRPGMLRLAGEAADGVILNWLSPTDVSRVVDIARAAARQAGRDPEALEVACRIFVCVSEDAETVRMVGRWSLAAYLTTPVYGAFHRWLGRGPALAPVQEAWTAGDRRAALDAVPVDLIDELFVHGSADACRRRIEEYCAAGVTLPLLHFVPTSLDAGERREQSLAAFRALARPPVEVS